MVLPQVKNINTERTFLLPFEMKVCVSLDIRENFHALLGRFFPNSTAAFTYKTNPHIMATKTSKKVNDEEYHLEISENGIYIEYYSYLGLRNAAATLAMMATACKDGYLLKPAVIDDYPAVSHRGTMLDLARGVKPYDTLVSDMILIAKSKMNYLHLHLFDSKGVCMQLDSIPEQCHLPNAYTKEQMKELVKIAEVLGLELIPEFDMPAHAKKLSSVVDEISCDIPDDIEDTKWTVCPGSDKTYELYDRVITELVEIFPCKYFHIGGDELEFADLPRLKQMCHWDSCSKCKKKMQEEKLADRQELYYYFIMRIYEMVKKAGRTMVMWSDQIDCNRPCPLPRDIIMHFWRVAEKGRGPVENCSMNAQLKMGYKVINSHFPETYVDLDEYMSQQTIADWRWDKRPECDDELAQNILGTEVCAWEYGNFPEYEHYDRTLAPNVVIMGDKLWNGTDLVFDEEYEKSLTRAVLGADTPKGLNIFKCFGSIIPPRSKDLAYYDKIKASKAEIEETLALLETIKPSDLGSRQRADAYKEGLKGILENIK